jgi:hypothetical protein
VEVKEMPPAFGESAESRRIIVVDLIEIFRRDPVGRGIVQKIPGR